jgi:hypothetical protein
LELLLTSDRSDREAWATDWSRDGKYIVEEPGNAGKSGNDLWVIPLSGDGKPTP